MLEAITKYGVVFYLMGAVVAIGLVAKLISYLTIRKVVRAAGEIQKSNHGLMRLIKAKFEHANMVSDKVHNVEVFVKKFLYEYRVWGCTLETWNSLPKRMIWLLFLIGFAGGFVQYTVSGIGEALYQLASLTLGGAIFLWSVYSLSDEQSKLEVAKNYMVDYLENVCLYRYEKASKVAEKAETIEIVDAAETAEMEAEVLSVQQKVELAQEEADKARQEQELRIRAILQEFLV